MSIRPPCLLPPQSRHFEQVAVVVLLAAAAAIYLPDVGHGFVKDDFVWIGRSDLSSWAGLASMFRAPTGFFRPTVSLLFGINRLACGVDRPRCYGVANLGLLVACAAGVAVLARAVLGSAGAAIAAAAIWVFNWHGINMAVLWISGRTSLALVLFATFGAAAFVKRQWIPAFVLLFAAMLSKEEGVLLPVVLCGWRLIDDRGAGQRRWAPYLALAGLEAAYFALRSRSGAFTAASAPDFYQLRFSIPRLLANILQYADRSLSICAVVLLAFWVATRPRRAALRPGTARRCMFGAMWWAGAFAITVFLPARSSLYAVFPSVGAALVAAAILEDRWGFVARGRRAAALGVGLCAPFLLWPVYAARNRPAVREAELSSAALAAVQTAATGIGPDRAILLRDDRAARPSLDNAFGTLLQDGVDLIVRPRVEAWIDPPPTDAARAGLKAGRAPDAVLALEHGAVVRVR